MNCQVGRRDNGGNCPHQSKRVTGRELLAEFENLREGGGNYAAAQTDAYKAALANVVRKSKVLQDQHCNPTIADFSEIVTG